MDYLLQAKIKNGRVFKAMRQMGMTSIADLARAAGIGRKAIDDLVNLKVPARNESGKWSKGATAAATALCCEPDDLFSDEQQWSSVSSNNVERYFTGEEIAAISNENEADPAMLIAQSEVHEKLNLLREKVLSPREEKVLQMRFDEDRTLRECGEYFERTPARIREIEGNALRKLRNKSHLLGPDE